jgi:hypothetical protein
LATSGVAISPGLGWKFDPGKAGGFFVAPSVTVPITLGITEAWEDTDKSFAVRAGVVVKCSLGWAF